MKFTTLRLLAATACALALAGCGGKASFDVSGTISGLSYPGLVLTNGGANVTPAVGATTFTFPNRVDYGTSYNVVATTQPAHEFCTVLNPTGSAGHTTTISVAVQCQLNSFNIGGTISGLPSTATGSLTLINGTAGGSTAISPGATTFVFADKVSYSIAYGVSVLTQPDNFVCSVSANGSGVMGDADVSNMAVTCVPKA